MIELNIMNTNKAPAIDDEAGAFASNGSDANNLAFRFKGRRGEQRTGDRGSAGKSKHQQYFTPKWVAETFPSIARMIFAPNGYGSQRPTVLDPNCGGGRLLVGFKEQEHQILGIELDRSVANIAGQVLNKENIRIGDILVYEEFLRDGRVDIFVINPPYDLWWTPLYEDQFEMVSGTGRIESQKAVLEISTKAMHSQGVLIGLFSQHFFENNQDAREYLNREYQVLAMIDLIAPYQEEYGINVNNILVVAFKNLYAATKRMPVTGVANNGSEILRLVESAIQKIFTPYNRPYTYDARFNVPHLEMIVEVDTAMTLNVGAKGIQPATPMAGAWAKTLDTLIPGYSPAEGTQTGLYEGIASLPNLLLGGIDPNLAELQELGFTTEVTDHARVRLEGLRKRFERERLPLTLNPVELLAYYDEGWYTAKETVNVGTHTILAGRRYHLTLRWKRATEHIKTEVSEERHDVLKTYVDLGYSIFELNPEGEDKPIILQETSVKEMQALITALGAPEVKTAAELPDIPKWNKEMSKLEKKLVARNGGLRLYDIQRQDVVMLATRAQAGLYYEQGGGKTPTSAYWATLRGYKRILVVCPSFLAPNWMDELTKWGFRAKRLDHRMISQIKDEKRQKILPDETTFYIVTYEQMKLWNPTYEPWEHDHFSRKGDYLGKTENIVTSRCPDCKVHYHQVVTECPKCGGKRPEWNGNRCTACGFQARYFQHDKTYQQWPMYKRVNGLFSAVILDESQVAKSSNSQVGRAIRALRAKGKLVLSGTPMKGYVTDLYWTSGWLLGFGSPLWPFPFKTGSSRFLKQFGTYQFVTKEFEDTLTTGKRKLIPAVSNLTRLWRLLSPTSIRRLKVDFLPELPEKQIHHHLIPMDSNHRAVYMEVYSEARDVLTRELHKDDPNMGAISKALWWMRYAASVPCAEGLSYYKDALGELGTLINQTMGYGYPKVTKAVELCTQAKLRGEKTIVFTSLRAFHGVLMKALKGAGLRVLSITSNTPTQKRVEKALELKNGYDVLVASTNTLNRGVTITWANNVIIANLEWSPEATEQAEDRVHRPGQTKDVNVHYLLSAGTVDEKMLDLITQKSDALHSVLDRIAQDTDVASLLEQVAAENAMMMVAKAIIEEPEPVKEMLTTIEEIKPAIVETVPASNSQANGNNAQMPLFGQKFVEIWPKRKPAPIVSNSGQQLPLFASL